MNPAAALYSSFQNNVLFEDLQQGSLDLSQNRRNKGDKEIFAAWR